MSEFLNITTRKKARKHDCIRLSCINEYANEKKISAKELREWIEEMNAGEWHILGYALPV